MYIHQISVAIFDVRERTEVRNNFNHKLVDDLNPKVPQGFFFNEWGQSVRQSESYPF